jgi:hypothetical protein
MTQGYKYTGYDHTNDMIARFLQLPVLERYRNGTVTYELWKPLLPEIGPEEYTLNDTIVWKNSAHVFELLFHKDINWLMYVVDAIEKTYRNTAIEFNRDSNKYSFTISGMNYHNTVKHSDRVLAIYNGCIEFLTFYFLNGTA